MTFKKKEIATGNVAIEWDVTQLDSIEHDSKGWVRSLNEEQSEDCTDSIQTSCVVDDDVISLYTTITMGESEYFQMNSIDLVPVIKKLGTYRDRDGMEIPNASFKAYIHLKDEAVGVLVFKAIADIGGALQSTPYGVKVSMEVSNKDITLTLNERYINLAVWGYSIITSLDHSEVTDCSALTQEQVAMLVSI